MDMSEYINMMEYERIFGQLMYFENNTASMREQRNQLISVLKRASIPWSM